VIDNTSSGRLLAFTGLDGSGKSTLVDLAIRWIESRGIPVHHAVLPTKAARSNPYFREYVADHRTAATEEVDLTAICAVCDADVLRFVRTEAQSLLEQGAWVVCDRYVYCSHAEMVASGSSAEELSAIHALHSLLTRPDLAVLARVPAEVSIARVHSRPNETNAIADLEYWHRIADGFDEAASHYGLCSIDTSTTINDAERELETHLERLITLR